MTLCPTYNKLLLIYKAHDVYWGDIGGQGVGCDERKEGTYEGSRKCVHKFCGSPEEEKVFLAVYELKKNSI